MQWSTPADWAEQHDPDRVFTPGTGAELALEPVVSAARQAQTDVDQQDNAYGAFVSLSKYLRPAR